MPTAKTFNALYRQLNPQQKKAVDAIEGPVMVIAGPGTGKTQILTLRIANILRKTDTSPDSILALTFTESGVFSMRKRLVEIMGSAGYRVGIFTFHGFCNDIIRRFPDAFPKIIGATHINDIDKISILKEIILKAPLKKLRPFGDNFYYVNEIRREISDLKRENISPKQLSSFVQKGEKSFAALPDLYYDKGAYKGKMKGKYSDLEKKLQKNKELALVYTAYQKVLTERRHYDYEDMIVETIIALEKNPDVLLQLQEEYQYILADEHQDANNSQNRLLELLASYHDNPNLFIVGDEKQAIFRFQGASLDNFLYFAKRFTGALVVTLETNYRSGQHILDSAHNLITKSADSHSENLRKPLQASKAESGYPKLSLRTFSKPEYEYVFLAHDIEKKIAEGVSPHEIAVLYRNNKDADPIIRIFEKTDIPFVIESDQNILADIDIRKLLCIFRAIEHFGSDGFILPTLYIDFIDIDNLDIYKISRFAHKKHIPIFAVVKSKKVLKEAGVKNVDALFDWYHKLSVWKKVAHNKNLLEFFEIVISESGFLNHILSLPEADIKLGKVNGLFDDLKALIENHRDNTLADYLDYLDLLEEHSIFIKKEARSSTSQNVRLMTAHKSKGLEFEYVYIVGAYDGHWGNKRHIKHFHLDEMVPKTTGNIEDERRLFYVALTRAKTGVSISYSKEGGRGELQLPSQFIEEIDTTCIQEIPTSVFEKNIAKESLLAPKKEKTGHTLEDKSFLNELFLEQGLSVTALNNYLTCPWNYFYSNLLRVPKAPTKHMLFGTAIHKALKDFFDYIKGGGAREKKILLSLYEDALKNQPFSQEAYDEAFQKGNAALSGYFDIYKKMWLSPPVAGMLNEFKVQVLLPQESERAALLSLRGVFDKIEILDSGSKVNVVDYKTGKPKSRNVIEGKTKSSDGNYKRQLIFYKILLDLFEKGKYHMISGEVDFIEPDEKGCYHKERFEVSEKEVSDLKKTINQTTEEILDLSFWNSTCDDKKCHWCTLREIMQ